MAFQQDVVNGLKWRSIGPHRGGRVVAVAGDVSQRETFYMGACAGGVWKTTDAGTIWRNVSDGFFTTAAVGAIAVSESDPNVIYVGTGETAIRGNVSHGDGVYRSTDAGRSWQNVGLAETRHIGKVIIHPTNPDIVYVAALGHVWGTNEERGVYRTQDGGKTWEQVLFKSARAGSHDLTMDPSNPRILYAAIWQAQRHPHALISGGEDSGIWRSLDGGDTWEDITRNAGLPQGILGKIGVAASGPQPGRVWALVEAHDGALFRSDDYGSTWERVNEEPFLRTRAWYYMHVIADTQDADTCYVMNYNMHKSIDGGKSFTEIPSRHGDEHGLWIDPSDPQRMIKGDDGGATVSYNGGRSWSTIMNQPTAQLYHVTADSDLPYRVYGSQQDNSAISVPSATMVKAIHERDWFAPGGGESGYITIKPSDPNVIVAGAIGSGNFNGRLIHFNRRTQQHRNITVWPDLAGMGTGAGQLKYRFQWTFPVFWSRHEEGALYAAGNRVFKSTDEGLSWQVVSQDLTRNDPSRLEPSGGPITKDNTGAEAYSTIFVLEESPHQRGLFWGGTDDGLVHISEDSGQNWQNITPASLPEWSMISIIDLSQHDPSRAYLAATNYKNDDTKPYLFRTTDFGSTWDDITNGIPDGEFTRVVREDPVQPGLLFAGTETGLFVSFNDGEQWQRIESNFPVVPVHDFIIKDNDLVVATHGRSFWILDDITPLRAIAAGLQDSGVTLLPRGPKLRMKRYDGFGGNAVAGHASYHGTDTSVYAYDLKKNADGSTEEVLLDAGENPPVGVRLYYHLHVRDGATNDVTMTIRDAQGETVRSFRSRPADLTDDKVGNETFIPAVAGLNRFDWDMRLEPASTVPGQKLRPWETPVGPVVLPGTYTVEVTAGERSSTQEVVVQKDPRFEVADADLQTQFDLLVEIRDRLSEVNASIARLRRMREQVETWAGRLNGDAKSDALREQATAISGSLTEIETQLVDTTTATSPLMAPSRLFEKFNALTEFASMGDGLPGRQGFEVFEELSARLAEQQARLSAVAEQDIAAFNAALAEMELAPVG